jgi:predicted nucleic acid-binding protein
VTVLDTSAVVDYLLGAGVAERVRVLIRDEGELAAPDVLVFEVLAVLRRESHRGAIAHDRALNAVEDLGDVSIELFPSLPLRGRAWALRHNITAADALFVTLAEHLNEPFATTDRALAREVTKHTAVTVIDLGG